MLLQGRGRMTAQALATEVEVSVRTVYRDIEKLSYAGVPVYAERGRGGGFLLLDGWRTRLTGLTPGEARALFLAGLPGPAAELGLGDMMAAAQLKVLAALPEGWQVDARRVSSRFHLDPLPWFRSVAPANNLREIADAVWCERRVQIRYESWNGVADREVEPLGLVLKAGVWYLAATGEDGRPRTYRLSNILEQSAAGSHFTRPTDFDLARYWTASREVFEAGLYCDTAVVRVSPRGRQLLRGLGAAAADAANWASATPDADGWARVTIPIESVDHAAGEMLKLGDEVEVLEPAELRERLAATVMRLAALYDRR